MDSKQPETSNNSESSTKSTDYPGKWRVLTNPDDCSIYRVPDCLRRVNPEAYTPQLVLIGPLNHSLKSQALRYPRYKVNGILKHGRASIRRFTYKILSKSLGIYRKIIEADEEKIRESYSESTAWINSPEFVEMILHDCVFVIEFILMSMNSSQRSLYKPIPKVKGVYFGNMWIGTATVAAVLLLLMTLIQTVASIIQAV